MPNAKISAQDRDAAAKRYAIYGEQIANYNTGVGDYNAGITDYNATNQAQFDAYNAQVAEYNANVAAGLHVTTYGWPDGDMNSPMMAQLSDGRWVDWNTANTMPGLVGGVDIEGSSAVAGQPNPLPPAPQATTKPAEYSGVVPEEPKGWNPSIAELKNLENPVVDAGTAEVAAAKGYTANRGIVGAEAERSKQLADPNEQPLTSNKGILARVLGGEL